jgi:thiopurine S-methyltransferase
LQPAFWHERWRSGQTGFHQLAVEPNLSKFWPHVAIDPDCTVFVPLCGKSCDLLWLAERGHSVIGVELSTIAVESFHLENGIAARRRSAGSLEEYAHENLRILQGDFFQISLQHSGVLDAVYDRGALISWAPELRPGYAEHMTALTAPGTQTLLLTLEYPQHQTAGPPFSVSAEELHELYGRRHEIQLLSRQNVLPTEARMRARGVTELTQVCYSLRRVQ